MAFALTHTAVSGKRLGAKSPARRSTADHGARTSMFQDELTSPGDRGIKRSEPMWTSFFERHTGPVPISAHKRGPDTRPIEAPRRPNGLKMTLHSISGGIHERSSRSGCCGPASCVGQGRSRKCACRPCLPPSPARRRLGIVRCRPKAASPISSKPRARAIENALARGTTRAPPCIGASPILDDYDGNSRVLHRLCHACMVAL